MKRSMSVAVVCGQRTGLVLVLVLVIITALSFAVYSFSQHTLLEYTATRSALDHEQRRQMALSAMELSEAVVRGSADQHLFERGPVHVGELFDPSGSVAIVRTLPMGTEHVQYGLRDESSKLNLNALAVELSERKRSRQRLLALPQMTVQIADALLDWMDADDRPSEFGAESSYYTSLRPPYRPGQERFSGLHELLLVRGVTEQLLFGEDTNGNGRLDPNEDDGSASLPDDNANGVLDRGWSENLTLVSREGVLRPDGELQIRLNQPDLALLYDQLLPGFGEDMALYVVAMRMRGARFPDDVIPPQTPDEEERRLKRIETARRRLQEQLGTGPQQNRIHRAGNRVRGGLRLSSRPAYQIASLLDLFGGQVRITIDGEDQLLRSPWSADPGTLRRLLPSASELLTTSERTAIEGRININQATETVLQTIPGVTPGLARSIRQQQPKGNRRGQDNESISWLSTRGLVPVSQLRHLAPWITTGGDVQGGIALGWLENSKPVAGIDFLLDHSGSRRHVLRYRDLSALNLPELRRDMSKTAIK